MYPEYGERRKVLNELKERKDKDKIIALDFSGVYNGLRSRKKWG